MKKREKAMERRRRATKIRLRMTGCIICGSEALNGNVETLNDDGKSSKGIGAMKRR